MLQTTEPGPAPDPPAGTRRFRATRRGLLIGAGAGLGLLVGYALWPRTWPNAWVAGEGEVLVGPWIRVGTDGRVTVAVPQAEMGQGVMSGFAQIVADELGATWGMMAVEPAPWHPQFAHVGMARLGSAGLPPPLRGLAERLGAEAIRRLNLHLTGGSTSIMGYHDQLREAAAEARARLIMAAAQEWGVSASQLDTVNGFVRYKANRMSFADAAQLVDPNRDPPRPKLRPVADRRLEGRALPRLDIPPKVDGRARFGADVRVPGMVFAAIRHGPVGGRLASAEAPAGVQLVRGPNWVAATGITSFEAMRAVARVNAVFDAPEGEGPAGEAGPWIAQALTAALADGTARPLTDRGSVEAALGDTPVEASYSLPFLAHACLEPMTATARVTGDSAEVWGPTQSLTLAHWRVADALGLESDQVVIHPTLIGGGFGRKAEPDAMVEAALIARAVGKPVQLLWPREEDLAAGSFRPPVAAWFRGQLTADRKGIAAWDARIAVPSVGASFMGRTLPRFAGDGTKPSARDIEGADQIPYACGSFRVTHLPVPQPVPLGYWRAVGHSFSAFLVESFIDELAGRAAIDPLAFRLGLLADKPRHRAVLEAAADIGNWGQAQPRGFGRGIALHESFGSIVAMVVEAGVAGGQIVIPKVAVAIDCGRAIAPDSVRAQLEGGALMGLSAALGEAQTFEGGEAEARNFDRYELLRMAGSPHSLVTVIVPSDGPLGGVGEPGLPPAAPALANALHAATGTRARALPLARQYLA